MGEEDAAELDQNSYNGGEDSSKVLTLPTVLTLGRVAAVPILVASTFNHQI